nr:hypothetical protein [Tanacetum cinerariifolium]
GNHSQVVVTAMNGVRYHCCVYISEPQTISMSAELLFRSIYDFEKKNTWPTKASQLIRSMSIAASALRKNRVGVCVRVPINGSHLGVVVAAMYGVRYHFRACRNEPW